MYSRIPAYITMALIASSLLASTDPARSDDGNGDSGRALAQAKCSQCHALGPTGASPEKAAPPFRTFKSRWPLEALEEAFAEGIVVGHIMPEFQFDPEQIHDLIAFLKGIETGVQ